MGNELPHGICVERSELTLLRADDTADGMALVGLSPRCAIRNRCARDFIVDISENSSANTHTPYLLAAVVRAIYLRVGVSEFSFYMVRVPKYTPNSIASADAPMRDVTPIFGILLPSFGDFPNAICATWEVGSLAQRRPGCLGPTVFTSDADLDHGRGRPYLR